MAQDRGGILSTLGQTLTSSKFLEVDDVGVCSHAVKAGTQAYHGCLQWFDKKKAYLDALESQLKGLVRAIDLVAKQREGASQRSEHLRELTPCWTDSELATSIAEFSTSIGELSESDLSKDLRHSLSALAAIEKKAQDSQHVQAQEDTITLMTTGEFRPIFMNIAITICNLVEEYSRIINSVRVSMI